MAAQELLTRLVGLAGTFLGTGVACVVGVRPGLHQMAETRRLLESSPGVSRRKVALAEEFDIDDTARRT